MISSMNFFKIFFRKSLDNRLHITLSAVALMWLWSRLLSYPVRVVDYVILALVVAFICQWNRLTDQQEDRINCPDDLAIAVRERKKIRIFCFAAAALAMTLMILTTTRWLISAALLLAAALGFFYSTPLMPWKSSKRIKDLFIFKNLSSAIGWSIGTVLYPAMQSDYVADVKFYAALTYMAISTMTYEMIWDMRDIRGDRIAGVQTLPVAMGLPTTKRMVLILQGIAILLISIGILLSDLKLIWLFLIMHSAMLMMVAAYFDGKLKSSRMLTHVMVIATTLFSIFIGILSAWLP